MEKTKLTAIIPVRNLQQAKQELSDLPSAIDCVELRVDYLKTVDLAIVRELLQASTIDCIITLRSKQQGGLYEGNDLQRVTQLKQLMSLKPEYIDLEYNLDRNIISDIAEISPRTKIICSHHDFDKTPQYLDDFLSEMFHPEVGIYKLITTANNSIDSLRMLNLVHKHGKNMDIIGHCMGKDGMFSRVAAAVLGNHFTYAALSDDESVLPFQITLDQFVNLFRIPEKNEDTRLYALIGDPVEQSIGDRFHNEYFAKASINALYVKIRITKQEVADFFDCIRQLPFDGFSITMPLKQAVFDFVSNPEHFQAVNTLKRVEGVYVAANTDGVGALAAIEAITTIKAKRVLVLGAGGAAWPIIQGISSLEPASMHIANRSLDNARKIADRLGCGVMALLEDCEIGFDIIVNTLPPEAYEQAELLDWLRSLSLSVTGVVMDINYNKQTQPLQGLISNEGQVYLNGRQMFEHQARAQQIFWNTSYSYEG